MHNRKNMRKKKRKQNKKSLKLRWIIIGVLVCANVGWFGYATYAKYFSQSAKSGIAIATGIYFTANYAVHTDSDSFFESIVKSDYTGVTYNFDFEVRNYENNLLFNESGVSIPYTIEIWTEEQPVNANYTIQKAGGSAKAIGVSEANKTVLSGQNIAGGAAVANVYTISLNVWGNTHEAVPIYVRVKTDDGAVITRNLCGKMIITNVARPESFIEKQEFVVTNTSGTDDEKFAEIQSQSEFIYEIRTVGDVLDADEITEELKLSWDPTVFQLDLFDEAYLEWLSTTGATAPKTDTNGWKYFIVKVMPYSSETIGFFRGEQFLTKVWDMTTLNQYIEAEKYSGE